MQSKGRVCCGEAGVSRWIPDPVSGATDSLNEFACLAVVDFAPKSPDVNICQIAFGIEMIFPDVLTKLSSGKHAAWGSHQTFEQAKFTGGKIYASRASSCHSRSYIEA